MASLTALSYQKLSGLAKPDDCTKGSKEFSSESLGDFTKKNTCVGREGAAEVALGSGFCFLLHFGLTKDFRSSPLKPMGENVHG